MIAPPALPVPVRPFPAETAASYYRRLCRANSVSEHDLWLEIRQRDPLASLGMIPRRSPGLVAAYGGLPPRYLEAVGSDVGCSHDPTVWVRRCGFCRGRDYGPTTLCRRCTGGETVSVHQPVGPICLRHRRWHAGGTDIDVAHLKPQLAAQRRLNGNLRMRSIAYRSAEAAIARDLLYGWHEPLNTSRAQTSLEDEIENLPMLVNLLHTLASPMMVQVVEDRSIGPMALAALLQVIVRTARVGRTVDVAHAIAQVTGDASTTVPPDAVVSLLRHARVQDLDEVTTRLRRRIPTVRAHLLHHREQGRRGPLWVVNAPLRRVHRHQERLFGEVRRLRELVERYDWQRADVPASRGT